MICLINNRLVPATYMDFAQGNHESMKISEGLEGSKLRMSSPTRSAVWWKEKHENEWICFIPKEGETDRCMYAAMMKKQVGAD